MLPFLEMGLSDCGHRADGRAAMVAPERAVFKTSRREKLDMCLVSAARVRTKHGFESFARLEPGRTPPIRDQMLAHAVCRRTCRMPGSPARDGLGSGAGDRRPYRSKIAGRPLDCLPGLGRGGKPTADGVAERGDAQGGKEAGEDVHGVVGAE